MALLPSVYCDPDLDVCVLKAASCVRRAQTSVDADAEYILRHVGVSGRGMGHMCAPREIQRAAGRVVDTTHCLGRETSR